MTPPTIFDRDTSPLDRVWLLTASFYETRNKPIRNVPEEDGGSQPARGAPTAPLSPAGCFSDQLHTQEPSDV